MAALRRRAAALDGRRAGHPVALSQIVAVRKLPRVPDGDSRAARGAEAESAAARHLLALGVSILDRNVRCRLGEIDIVARDGACTVFVEVRMRAGLRFGGALASVDSRKQRRLIAAARWYLGRHPKLANEPCRFDVIGVESNGGAMTWLRDAFRVDG